jgi:hypothetical protein
MNRLKIATGTHFDFFKETKTSWKILQISNSKKEGGLTLTWVTHLAREKTSPQKKSLKASGFPLRSHHIKSRLCRNCSEGIKEVWAKVAFTEMTQGKSYIINRQKEKFCKSISHYPRWRSISQDELFKTHRRHHLRRMLINLGRNMEVKRIGTLFRNQDKDLLFKNHRVEK